MSRKVYGRTQSGEGGPANITTWDGKKLYYYKDGFGWSGAAVSTGGLLASANGNDPWAGHGECGAFAHLLIDSVAANGTTIEFVKVKTINRDRFIIKDWLFSATPSYPDDQLQYLYKLTLIDEGAGNVGMVPSPFGRVYGDLTKMTSLLGQNSAPPSEECFIFHYIIKYDGIYYDPSYGVTYVDAVDFENKSIEGYALPRPNSMVDFQLRKPNEINNIQFDIIKLENMYAK